MLCFSVESRDSLENVQEKWWDEIARHCEGCFPPPPGSPPVSSWIWISGYGWFWRGVLIDVGVKLVLVALKCDLRDDEGTKERLAKYGEKCISYEEGLAMAKLIKAVRYLGILPHPLLTSPTLPPPSLILGQFVTSPVCPFQFQDIANIECSAKHNRGVLEAFTEASRVSLTARAVGGDPRAEERKKSSSCVIL